ncbi:DUF2262 domain-containing protein [Erysipelotrichaceae bacterium HCN-30851]
MSNNFLEKYDTDEQEIIVLIENVSGASYFEEKWEMLATTIGMQFVKDDILQLKKGRLNWLVSDEERNGELGWKRFKKGQIYRIKARKMLEKYIPKNLKGSDFNAWCVVDVLDNNVICPDLKKAWEDYNKPIVINDDVLGELALNKEYEVFEGYINWDGKVISLMLEVDVDDNSTWDQISKSAKEMIIQLEQWDKKMREFSSKKLTVLANQWASDEKDIIAPITEDDFANRISISELVFSSDDAFSVMYDDDEMFWGYAIEVQGTLEKGIESSNIIG